MRTQVKFLRLLAGALLASAPLPAVQAAAGATNAPAISQIGTLRVFARPLEPVGTAAVDEGESRELLQCLQLVGAKGREAGITALEEFLSSHPRSPWAPSIRSGLARYYREHGHYTPALTHWEQCWAETKGYTNGPGKAVADYTFAHWTRLLGSLGRKDQMQALFDETKGRSFDRGPLQQLINGTKEGHRKMITSPGTSYMCGLIALESVGQAVNQTNLAIKTFAKIRCSEHGFTLRDLVGIAREFNIPVEAVQRRLGEDLIVPSVVHWKQNHYAAILERKDNRFKVVDPTFGHPLWLDAKTINSEASGYFLVPTRQVTAAWGRLKDAEAAVIYGMGFPNNIDDDDDGGGDDGGGDDGRENGDEECEGMARWRISQPYISLFIHDLPVFYRSSDGRRHGPLLSYKQREARDASTYAFGFGPLWNFDLLSFVEDDNDNTLAYLHKPGGGKRTFTPDGLKREYLSNARLVRQVDTNSELTGFQLFYRDGSLINFGLVVTGVLANPMVFMTERISPTGQTNRYEYETTNTTVLLKRIVDIDGRTNTVRYDTNYPTQISEFEDPFGRKAQFQYDGSGNLTNIVDAGGLSSAFTYDNEGSITNLTTPYGTTSFEITGSGETLGSGEIDRSALVSEPGGVKQLFVYRDGSSGFMSDYNTDFPVTNSMPEEARQILGNSYMYYRNSWHWNRNQYAALSDGAKSAVTNLTTADYKVGHLKNWLHKATMSPYKVGQCLNFERRAAAFAAEDPVLGQGTWYGFYNKGLGGAPNVEGKNIFPDVKAKVLPDGSTWFEWYRRNTNGYITNLVSSFSVGTNVYYRTNIYVYATNDVDLLEAYGPNGNLVEGRSYDGNHQVLTKTNAVGDVTTYTYDANRRVTSVALPTGLTTTNLYGTNGYLQTTIDMEIGRTNSYAYTNGLVYLHTDPRGLTVTNTWDALNRLTSVTYPDGTVASNRYSRLDLVARKDRMGNWGYYGYNDLAQRTLLTNALGYVWQYTYCNCGAIGTITDPLTNVITFSYDLNGQLRRTLYGDGSYRTNVYNLSGQLEKFSQGGSVWVTNSFNNQGLPIAVSNAAGALRLNTYDIENRLTNTVDANGVSATITYDAIGRRLTVSKPDGGLVRYAHSARGITAFTNQLGLVSYFGYDESRRKLADTNANGEVIRFSYNAASDLLQIVDAKNQTNRWNFNEYGRTTNKVDATGTEIFRYLYDASGRLTNRWSLAKGNTGYGYDAFGNLTNVNYATSSDISFAYDAANRQTNMVDAVGTTRYAYTAAGLLSAEDGPWADDTVTYAYNSRRQRSSLSLPSWSASYAYDGAGRLQFVADQSGLFTYGYSGAGLRVQSLTLPTDSYITNAFDSASRLTATYLRSSAGVDLNHHTYGYDLAGQRTNTTRFDGSKVSYTYDNIGQLKTGLGQEADNSARLHEQFGYAYDAAGNLNYRTNNALIQNFNVDLLNQLTTNSRSGTFTAAGVVLGAATNVSVNGSTASRYGDGTFARDGLSLSDGTNTFTAVAQDATGNSATNAVTAYLPATNLFQYDGNGNLLSDGRMAYAYDDENQLISVQVTNAWKSDFTYDGRMRRRIRKEYSWQGGVWVQTNEVRYVYDDKLVLQERTDANLPTVSYTRGIDLLGSLQGAGGIGGMLARTDHGGSQASAFYHADGNGNITALLNSSEAVVARYLYDPFGRLLTMSGILAEANLYRFSSKESHANSGLTHYLYRYYSPELQRWLSRDPIAEGGGLNLFRFVRNNSIRKVDAFGLIDVALVIDIDLVSIWGADITFGIVVDTDDLLDSGLFLGGGLGVGASVGCSIGLGIYNEIEGQSNNLDFNVGPASVTGSWDPITGEFIGGSVTAGPGAGVVGSNTGTNSITVGDVVNAVNGVIDAISDWLVPLF